MSDIDLTLMVCRDEDGQPVVCGAWETSLLDIIGTDETEAMFAKARDAWLPDYVDWREIRVTVNRDDILKSFESRTVRAKVR